MKQIKLDREKRKRRRNEEQTIMDLPCMRKSLADFLPLDSAKLQRWT